MTVTQVDESSNDMHPDDTIVVPLDARRMRLRPLWTAVTTINYGMLVALATVNSI